VVRRVAPVCDLRKRAVVLLAARRPASTRILLPASVAHFSLPAFDDGANPTVVDAACDQSANLSCRGMRVVRESSDPALRESNVASLPRKWLGESTDFRRTGRQPASTPRPYCRRCGNPSLAHACDSSGRTIGSHQ